MLEAGDCVKVLKNFTGFILKFFVNNITPIQLLCNELSWQTTSFAVAANHVAVLSGYCLTSEVEF